MTFQIILANVLFLGMHRFPFKFLNQLSFDELILACWIDELLLQVLLLANVVEATSTVWLDPFCELVVDSTLWPHVYDLVDDKTRLNVSLAIKQVMHGRYLVNHPRLTLGQIVYNGPALDCHLQIVASFQDSLLVKFFIREAMKGEQRCACFHCDGRPLSL